MNNITKPNYEIKLIFLGEDLVGKSSLVHKMLYNSSITGRAGNPDIIQIKNIDLAFGSIRLLVFDPVTKLLRKNVEPMMKNFFDNCSGVFLLFDLTSISTLEKLAGWKEQLEKYLPHKAKRVLVGTKADLPFDKNITIEKIQAIAQEMTVNDFIATSAQKGLNVELCLNAMIFAVLRN